MSVFLFRLIKMTITEFKKTIQIIRDRAKNLEEIDIGLSKAYEIVADDMEEELIVNRLN